MPTMLVFVNDGYFCKNVDNMVLVAFTLKLLKNTSMTKTFTTNKQKANTFSLLVNKLKT